MASVAGLLEFSINVTLPIRYRLMQKAFPNQSTFVAHGRILGKIAALDFVSARAATETHILEDLEEVKLAVAEGLSPAPEEKGLFDRRAGRTHRP
jgi:DNA-binding GntR family transcriptional regulator